MTNLLYHKGVLPVSWVVSPSVYYEAERAKAGRREVTLLKRLRNNGLFFPGSLLHPHHCPPIGPQSVSIHHDRKLWQTAPTFSTNRGPAYWGDSFSKALSLTNSVFIFWQKKCNFKHKNTQNVCLNNELKTVYVTMSQKPKGKFSWPMRPAVTDDNNLHLCSLVNFVPPDYRMQHSTVKLLQS